MGCLRPATPGFLVTLIATALLAVVSFNVPIIKSVFFLKASVTISGQTESIVFGTLGYCLTLPSGTTCSKPSVGYQLDVNALLGDNTPIKIPTVLVKWITYALVLHIVALVLAGISAVFGLLAHVREMSMTYCSTCVSGFSATVALVAFIFDLVLFFLTKTRVNDVEGGHAEMGISIWLTLAAFLLLFFAGCFYGLGRCCIRRRPKGFDRELNRPGPDNGYAEQMRLEAVKAEADRKARQLAGKPEVGLPAFQEHERQPLTSKSDEQFVEDGDQVLPYHPQQPSAGSAGFGAGTAAYSRQPSQTQPRYAGGYAQAAPGTRAVDAYYNAPAQAQTTYPTPARQGSQHTQGPSTGYSDPYALPAGAAPAAVGAAAAGSYLSTAAPYAQYGHQQQPTTASYNHPARGTSYHSAMSHQQYPSEYNATAAADPFAAQPPMPQTAFSPDAYNTTTYMHPGAGSSSPPPSGGSTNPYRAPGQYSPALAPPERNYTLGGGGYGSNVVPAMDVASSTYPHYSGPSPAPSAPSTYSTSSAYTATAPAPINTSVQQAPGMPQPTSPRGPRDPNPAHSMPSPIMQSPMHEEPEPEEAPPMYDAATAQPPGQWGAKH
ncbi:pali-domain-containing protein [Trametes coccinea BRFM310]|uniref:Pali-domain-containing protein n=1 Tax=Trametes coccinea (strain BRFM310) TaxID=1353009 RepID=A0A1Y2ISK6_TRAC3|nr:pali-domain-containing protein [Trametes coccinea BRFM310]